MTKSIDVGFRWIDEITIRFSGGRPKPDLQLKVSADVKNQKFEIEKGEEETIRRVSNEKIPCAKTKEVLIELFECERKQHVLKNKVPILSVKVLLKDDELYVEKMQTSDDGEAFVTIAFAYTPAGVIRNKAKNARRITEEQKLILDKIKHVHLFFQVLEKLCDAVDDVYPYTKSASAATLSLYKLCEKQKECRDAARELVDEMDTLWNLGAGALGAALRKNSTTKAAFKPLADVIEDICKFIEEHSKQMTASLRGAISASYESKVEELKEKLTAAKEGLRDSRIWERVFRADLRDKLESVMRAHYSPGEGCLENTRKALLTDVDTWIRGSGEERTAWVHGYAGSGKSALLNSIAEHLEKARIPFTCFPCKRDDPDLSDVHKILITIAYIFTEYYDDYAAFVSNLVDKPAGRELRTGNIKKRCELLLGEAYERISPKGANRPNVHVILIDAFDECRNHRDEGKTVYERRALLKVLLDFANTIPWIKILITSRPEPDIVGTFTKTTSTIHRININDDKWGTSADIRLFVADQSKKLKLDLSPDQVERFQVKASGLFIWCSTVFRYIEESKDRRDIVNEILSDQAPDPRDDPHAPLYFLYQRVLDSVVFNAEDKCLMEIILSIIFVTATRRPLSAKAIADILYPNEDGKGLMRHREWVGNIIRSLFAIIYVEEGTGVVRVCHPSVLDFVGGMLTDPSGTLTLGEGTARPFSIRLEEIHARMFHGCFTLMDRGLRFNICELEDSSRLNEDVPDLPWRITEHISEALQYGSLFWFSHLEQFNLDRGDVPVPRFLDSPMALYWIEALSLLNAIDRGIVVLQDCARFYSHEPTIAKLASEWERFLLAYGAVLRSTPHLYLSALSWIPERSPLRHSIAIYSTPEVPMVANVAKAWGHQKWSENVGVEVMSVAYSADGRLFAAGCADGYVRLWDARSGQKEREPFMTNSKIWSISFSPDNHWLASGHDDYNIRLWDLRADPAYPRVLEDHTDSVHSVSFSTDSKKLVSGSSDGSIAVWDAESGTRYWFIKGYHGNAHSDQVTSVAFSADDCRIFSGSFDYTVRNWDSRTGEQIGGALHSLAVRSVAVSRDGRFVAYGSDNSTVRLVDARSGIIIGTLNGHSGWVSSVCSSADSKYIASGSYDRSIRIWSVEGRSLVRELLIHDSIVNSVAFSPDGLSILSGSDDGTVQICDPHETMETAQQSVCFLSKVTCVSYSPDGTLIAAGSEDGKISIWDAQTGSACGSPFLGHTESVNDVSFSSDGKWLVSGSNDHSLRLWSISGKALGEPLVGHEDRVKSIAVSSDNDLIASGACDYTVRLWNVATRTTVKILEGHTRSVTSVAFLDNSKAHSVVSGSDDWTMRVWDTLTGDAVGDPLIGHSFWVHAVAVSPDGKWIASGSYDRTARIWCTTSRTAVHVLECGASVESIVFSTDSKYVITGCWQAIQVWSVQSGKALGTPLLAHTERVNSISVSPSGLQFVSGSRDGTIRVWDIRARTDLDLYDGTDADYNNPNEEESLIRWNACRARLDERDSDGWVRDEDKLLLWIPRQYHRSISNGWKLIIGDPTVKDVIQPEVDHRALYRMSGKRWTDIDQRTVQ